MPKQVIPFKLYEANDLSGMVKEESLMHNFMIEPQKASQFVRQVLQAENVADFADNFPTEYVETARDLEWDLHADGDKNIPLVKCEITEGTTISSTSQTGLGGGEFFLYFAENWFFITDVLAGEENEIYPIRVEADPVQVGALWQYRCRLLTGDSTLYIPYEELTAGKRFSRDAPAVAKTLSTRGAGISYSFPYKMISCLSQFRLEDKVPGDMNVQPLTVAWKDAKTGKTFTNWLDRRNWEFEMTYQKMKNYLIHYSTSNRADDGTFKNFGAEGELIKRGAGLKQQQKSANFFTYNEFNIKTMSESILQLAENKISKADRKVVLDCGLWGANQFHEGLQDYASYWTPSQDSYRIFNNGGDEMGYRGVFTQFKGPGGVELTINVNPNKDNRVRFKKLHPTKPGTLESYNYDIYSLTAGNGEANIKKFELTGGRSDTRAIIPGIRCPYPLPKTGGANIAATPVDGWEEHKMYIGGVIMYDPSRAASFNIITL